MVNVIAIPQDVGDEEVLSFNYTVSGGEIVGSGPRVKWDLSKVQPGIYAISGGADDGCGFCGPLTTRFVSVSDGTSGLNGATADSLVLDQTEIVQRPPPGCKSASGDCEKGSIIDVRTVRSGVMSDITAKLDELQQRTGIDIRQFESVAAGLAMKAVGPKETDYDPVIIARGTMPAGGLVAVVKLASNGTYKEEKIGTRTVYIFSAKDIAQKQVQTSNSKITGSIDRAISGLHVRKALRYDGYG